MAYEQRELSGSLFKNDKKEEKTHADYKGSILINGVEYWLNAWIKEGKSGKWMSLAAKPKEKQASRSPEKQPMREPGEDLEENPF